MASVHVVCAHVCQVCTKLDRAMKTNPSECMSPKTSIHFRYTRSAFIRKIEEHPVFTYSNPECQQKANPYGVQAVVPTKQTRNRI